MSSFDYFNGFSGFPDNSFHTLAEAYWENGYQTLMPSVGKAIFVPGWQMRGEKPVEHDDLLLAVNHYTENNLSLVYGPACPVVCIDIDDKDNAHDLEALTFETLGPTPLISVGNWPKRKLLYRKAEGHKFLTRRFQPILEVFGGSGQTVLEGLHPGTLRPYSWVEASPATLPLAELPEITMAHMGIFERAVLRWMQHKGLKHSERPGAFGKEASAMSGPVADMLAQMRMERASTKTPQEFIGCITTHVQKMRPGNRHHIMTATVAAMVRREWSDSRIFEFLRKPYIDKFGDHFSLRTNKVTKAITSARTRVDKWAPQFH